MGISVELVGRPASNCCSRSRTSEEASGRLARELCPSFPKLGGQLPRSEQLAGELRPTFSKLGGSLRCRPRPSQEANPGCLGLCCPCTWTHPSQLCPVCPGLCWPSARPLPSKLCSGPAQLPAGGS